MESALRTLDGVALKGLELRLEKVVMILYYMQSIYYSENLTSLPHSLNFQLMIRTLPTTLLLSAVTVIPTIETTTIAALMQTVHLLIAAGMMIVVLLVACGLILVIVTIGAVLMVETVTWVLRVVIEIEGTTALHLIEEADMLTIEWEAVVATLVDSETGGLILNMQSFDILLGAALSLGIGDGCGLFILLFCDYSNMSLGGNIVVTGSQYDNVDFYP